MHQKQHIRSIKCTRCPCWVTQRHKTWASAAPQISSITIYTTGWNYNHLTTLESFISFQQWIQDALLRVFFVPSKWIMCFRFESLEPEMNNQASRVAVVNQIARQLMHSGHPSEKDIKAQQDKLNTRQVSTFIWKIQGLSFLLFLRIKTESLLFISYMLHMNTYCTWNSTKSKLLNAFHLL